MQEQQTFQTNLRNEDYILLVVDDNPTNLAVACDYLKLFGFKLAVARDGESALMRTKYVKPDLILLDVMMPGMDGFEVCQRLKATENLKDIPVIFMTALARANDKVKGFQVGAVDYVTKPFQQEEVLARVTTHLKIRDLTRNLQKQNTRLEISSQVGQQVTSILNLDELMAAVVGLIQTKFDYYFTGVWLLNAQKDAIVLEAGVGRGGGHTLKPGVSISLDTPRSIIAWVCQTGQDYAADDVKKNDKYLSMGALTETRSELALPLQMGQELIGVLDVQSEQLDAFFYEDRRLMQSLADQIAIAIYNAQLYHLEEERVRELAALNENLINTQSQLVESEKMAALGGLVAGVAHEINTPVGVAVTAASAFAEEMTALSAAYKNDEMDQEEFEEFLDFGKQSTALILSNLNRAADLVQSFKQVAVDQSSEQKRTFVIRSYLEEVLLTLKPKFKRSNHQVKIDCDESLTIKSHPGTWSQIVTNLVMNSLLHAYQTGEKGHLAFDIHVNNGQLNFEYYDDGRGIPPENVGKIFNPFFTTRRGDGGSGLGLHIIYNLVTQRLNGTIHCESEVGVGTKFIIELPLKGD